MGVVVNVENIEDADQFEGLHDHFGRFQEFDGPALLLCGSEKAYQHADAARIDHGNFFEIQDEAGFASGEEIGECGAELVRRLAEDQLAA